MGLERLKFWHWMIIGVLVGVGFGYIRSQLRNVGAPQVRSWVRGQFTETLHRDRSIVRKLVLHPADDGQEWVTGEIYQTENKSFTMPYNGPRPGGRRAWWQRNPAPATQPAPAATAVKPPLPKGEWVELLLLAGEPGRKDKDYKVNVSGKEYLEQLKKEFPADPTSERDLNYKFAWWEVPQNTMAIYGAGGFVVIGVLWPALISLLMGVGLAKRPPKDDYDLDRFKGGAEPKAAAAVVSTTGDDELAALNAKLEAGVADMLQTSTAPNVDHEAEHAAVVKKLETRAMDATEGAVATKSDPKEYGGEFYPVAKPGTHKNDPKH